MELDRLLYLWEKLGERERKVWMTIGQRLWNGQKLHGKLELNKKNWNSEAIEEHLDATVYMACQLHDFIENAYNRSVKDAEDEVTKGAQGQPKEDTATDSGIPDTGPYGK